MFENTGGSFPELITRADIKLFLPPIGGLTVYCFGDPAKMSDPNVKLALRVHDECNGSDVFGSDICTCRPYLLFGIEEAVKEAQNGGSGVVIYFRKEGRALGEVTKVYLFSFSCPSFFFFFFFFFSLSPGNPEVNLCVQYLVYNARTHHVHIVRPDWTGLTGVQENAGSIEQASISRGMYMLSLHGFVHVLTVAPGLRYISRVESDGG